MSFQFNKMFIESPGRSVSHSGTKPSLSAELMIMETGRKYIPSLSLAVIEWNDNPDVVCVLCVCVAQINITCFGRLCSLCVFHGLTTLLANQQRGSCLGVAVSSPNSH